MHELILQDLDFSLHLLVKALFFDLPLAQDLDGNFLARKHIDTH